MQTVATAAMTAFANAANTVQAAVSPLTQLPAIPGSTEALVDNACNTNDGRPSLGINMEICDILNTKQKGHVTTSPREACQAILKNVNGFNASASLNALTLLDHLVKNCGYPLHLIVSTKEFLNELVKRFPERPMNVTPVQNKTLELIQSWNATICQTSRYKADFKHIGEMYRLLSFKGYTFPRLSNDSAAVLAPRDTLQTEDELEEEDKVAQGAKLQELLRLGTPSALEQANELMKVMAGYDLDRVPNYTKQVESELERIETQVLLLNDVLLQKRPGDRSYDATVEELHGSAKSAQSRIQKLVNDGDDESRIERLLQLNDLINNVLTNYNNYKNGKFSSSAISNMAVPQQRNSAAVSPTVGPISLIDFEDSSYAPQPVQSPAPGYTPATFGVAQAPSAPMDDIFGLDFLGTSGAAQQAPSVSNMGMPITGFGTTGMGIGGMGAGTMGIGGIGGFGGMQASNFQQTRAQPIGGYGANNVNMGGSPMMGHMPAGHIQQPWQNTASAQAPGMSPSLPNMQRSPMQSQLPAPVSVGMGFKTGSDDMNLDSLVSTPAPQESTPTSPIKLSTLKDVFNKNGLQIKWRYTVTAENTYNAQFVFIDTTPVPFTNLNFQLAMPKSMQMQLDPISSTVLAALNQEQVVQSLRIANPTRVPLRFRYKVSYMVNGASVEESGDYSE